MTYTEKIPYTCNVHLVLGHSRRPGLDEAWTFRVSHWDSWEGHKNSNLWFRFVWELNGTGSVGSMALLASGLGEVKKWVQIYCVLTRTRDKGRTSYPSTKMYLRIYALCSSIISSVHVAGVVELG